MKIELFNVVCPQLGRRVTVAIDVESTDPYCASFRTVFNIPQELQFLIAHPERIRCFVDVGANIGHFTLAAGLLGIPTVAIEALSDNYLVLTKALSANEMRGIVPLHLAASDDFSLVALQGHGTWAQVAEVGTGDTPGVPLDALLPLVGGNAPDLIKIDVEGHEIPVLAGLADILETARPMLIFEGNNWTARDSGGYSRLLQAVADYDYDLFVYNLDGTCRPVTPKSAQDVVCVDYFAYPRGGDESRLRPQIRVLNVDERLARIEAEVDAGEPHRWHITSTIEKVTSELNALAGEGSIASRMSGSDHLTAGESERLQAIRQRLGRPLPS